MEDTNKKIAALEEKIGYKFNNREYIITALTHSSYANEMKTKKIDIP